MTDYIVISGARQWRCENLPQRALSPAVHVDTPPRRQSGASTWHIFFQRLYEGLEENPDLFKLTGGRPCCHGLPLVICKLSHNRWCWGSTLCAINPSFFIHMFIFFTSFVFRVAIDWRHTPHSREFNTHLRSVQIYIGKLHCSLLFYVNKLKEDLWRWLIAWIP